MIPCTAVVLNTTLIKNYFGNISIQLRVFFLEPHFVELSDSDEDYEDYRGKKSKYERVQSRRARPYGRGRRKSAARYDTEASTRSFDTLDRLRTSLREERRKMRNSRMRNRSKNQIRSRADQQTRNWQWTEGFIERLLELLNKTVKKGSSVSDDSNPPNSTTRGGRRSFQTLMHELYTYLYTYIVNQFKMKVPARTMERGRKKL